jgi:phage host-nuclease inhibitor protein Gam
MAKRGKKVVNTGITGEEMEQAFSDYAIADAKIAKINASMDVEITKVREKNADELASLQDKKGKAFDVLQSYAIENRTELFGKKKSMETVHGVFGFRMGTPKLKTLKGFTWKAVTKLLREFLPAYIRIEEEPAKDMLLADREKEDVAELFPRVGIFVDQDETFFVERKTEEIA